MAWRETSSRGGALALAAEEGTLAASAAGSACQAGFVGWTGRVRHVRGPAGDASGAASGGGLTGEVGVDEYFIPSVPSTFCWETERSCFHLSSSLWLCLSGTQRSLRQEGGGASLRWACGLLSWLLNTCFGRPLLVLHLSKLTSQHPPRPCFHPPWPGRVD